jgi:hypothetical protein
MTNEPDADPFTGLGEGRSFRRVKQSRGALARKVAASLVFVAGCLLLGLGLLMHMAQESGWEPPFPFADWATIAGGFVACGLAFALYDRRWGSFADAMRSVRDAYLFWWYWLLGKR